MVGKRPEHWHIMGILTVIIIGITLLSGCVNQPADTPQPQNTTPTIVAPVTKIPTVKLTPSQSYKIANVLLKLNTKPATPAFGFKMDCPSNWSYTKEGSPDWNAEYNFSSPDGKSSVIVDIANEAGSATYLDPLDIWTNDTITEITQPYCHDGAGTRTACSPTEPGSAYHHLFLMANAPLVIPGSIEARKLVFRSYDDPTYGEKTVYLIYAGKMKGYNFTVPYHYEIAVKVTGPVWDYGRGGSRYMITSYTSNDHVNTTSGIFRHMINSFKITK